MKTVHIKKDDRFAPIVIKPTIGPAGHQRTTIGTGVHKDKRRKARSTERVLLSKGW